jgi:hypothetical protein
VWSGFCVASSEGLFTGKGRIEVFPQNPTLLRYIVMLRQNAQVWTWPYSNTDNTFGILHLIKLNTVFENNSS